MTPPDDEAATVLVRDWIAKAEEDFGLARHLIDTRGDFPHSIGFHCQQAAEKFLKALLTHHGLEAPRTHGIKRLLTLLASVEPDLASKLAHADMLTDYAAMTRYPGSYPERNFQDGVEALELASQVREAVLARVEKSES